jgi:flagellar motor switch protein FliN/FliY
MPDRSKPGSQGLSQAASGVRVRRLLNVPVQVSVRLAEKRVELDSVVSLVPGAIITFNKSCEDSLDLYVNNQHFARGEAVKIGEKFGLRLTEVDVKPVRLPRIIEG